MVSTEGSTWSCRGALLSTPKAASRMGLPRTGARATGTALYNSCMPSTDMLQDTDKYSRPLKVHKCTCKQDDSVMCGNLCPALPPLECWFPPK